MKSLEPKLCRSIYIRELDHLDTNSARKIDRFLIDARRYLSFEEPEFQDLIHKGVQLVLAEKDKSLCETMIIVLGERCKNFPDLIGYAMELARDDQQMKRVLYNFLRTDFPEVRDFAGDGFGNNAFFYNMPEIKTSNELKQFRVLRKREPNEA